MSTDPADTAKRAAAAHAAALVRPDMRLGLGSGSTAMHFVDLVGRKVREGVRLVCVPTSEATRAHAESLDIPLTTLDATPELDLTVDGADEFDDALNLVKGGGGALLREKIVAGASKRMVAIADRSKQVATLGRFPLPVEVAPFGLGATRRRIEKAAGAVGCAGAITLRHGGAGHVFVTDGGHYILDCAFGSIPEPQRLAAALDAIPGVMEHGLFVAMASAVIVADPDGVEIFGSL